MSFAESAKTDPPGGCPPGGVRIRTFRKLMQLVATHARARACNSLRAKVLRTFSYTHVAHHTLAHMRACNARTHARIVAYKILLQENFI